MNKNYLKVFVAAIAVMLFTSMPVRAAEEPLGVIQVSGEIAWIDLKLGRLQLQRDTSSNKGEISEYRITEHETRVTNPSDSKFLSIGDLQPGHHVTIDVINDRKNPIIQKITTEPRPGSKFQEAYGQIETIDTVDGKLTLDRRPRAVEAGQSELAYFVFEPQNIVVMHSPSRQPVALEVKPGDVVKVEYVVSDGKQRAKSITVYSPKVTSTTTTTTTTTQQW